MENSDNCKTYIGPWNSGKRIGKGQNNARDSIQCWEESAWTASQIHVEWAVEGNQKGAGHRERGQTSSAGEIGWTAEGAESAGICDESDQRGTG